MYAVLTQYFWYSGNAKRAIKENIKCTNPVIKYKVVALLTQVHVFLLMFDINPFWFDPKHKTGNGHLLRCVKLEEESLTLLRTHFSRWSTATSMPKSLVIGTQSLPLGWPILLPTLVHRHYTQAWVAISYRR
jgi:hypothetical protein